jgi:hypothetical protein
MAEGILERLLPRRRRTPEQHAQDLEAMRRAGIPTEMPFTGPQAAYFGAQMAPGAGALDAGGYMPSMPSREQGLLDTAVQGRFNPSIRQNIRQGNYFDAALQGLGLLGDGAYVIPLAGPIVAGALKAPRAIQATARAARAASDLSDIPRGAVNITTPRVTDAAARVSTTGKYIGAPGGIDSPQKLGGLRQSLRQAVEDGIPGRDWYQRSSEAASMLTGNRPGYKQLYTGNLAATSQGASVASNQGFAVKGYNQALTGQDIDTGRFPSAVRAVIEPLSRGEDITLGPKLGPFYQATNVSPGEAVARPTNDIWMARAFNYRTPDGDVWEAGLSEAQHRFMDSEIANAVRWANENKIGGYDDWTPEKVQASIWVSEKSKAENIPVSEAAQDFADNLNRLTANINVEAEPARGLMHLAGTINNPELSQALSEGQRRILSNPIGQDILSLSTGALTRPTVPGYGYYKGASAPADVLRVLSGTETGAQTIDPASRQLVEGVAAAQGLLRAQESVGYNFVREGGKLAERNAGIADLGNPPTQQQMLDIGARLDSEFGGAIIPTNTGNGVNYLVVDDLSGWASANNINANNPADLAKAWQKRLSEISNETLGVKPKWGINSGDLVGSFEAYKPSAYLPYIENMEETARGLLDRQTRISAANLENLDELLIKDFPNAGQRSDIVRTTRQALSEGGFARVQELVDAGVLPALVLALVGGGLLSNQQQSGQPSA